MLTQPLYRAGSGDFYPGRLAVESHSAQTAQSRPHASIRQNVCWPANSSSPTVPSRYLCLQSNPKEHFFLVAQLFFGVVFALDWGAERLIDGLLCPLPEASAGYVITVPRTLANGVRV